MLKRILSLFLCAVMVMSLVPAQAFAAEDVTDPPETVSESVEETTVPEAAAESTAAVEETVLDEAESSEVTASGTCGEDLIWEFYGDTGTLYFFGTGEMEDYSHYSQPWYSHVDSIRNVVVTSGVTAIGSRAFFGLDCLTQVDLPDTLLTIGHQAFGECSSLKGITIPASVTCIRWMAFTGCTGLERITIPVTATMEAEAFAFCTGLTEVVLEEGFTELDTEVFSGCTSLSRVTLPEGLQTIGSGAFAGCHALTEITIPPTVTWIQSSAFGRKRLEKSVSSGDAALEKTILFTGDAPEIEEGAFSESVIHARFPMGNPTWTAGVMQDYGGTVTWEPYGSVTGICGDALNWTLEDGLLTISGTGQMYDFTEEPAPWCSYHNHIDKVVVESGVTTIGSCAFVGDYSEYVSPGYANIAELELPDTLVFIGGEAFTGCYGLTSVTIPGSVTEIDLGAFAGCENLETVALSEGLRIIGDSAFDFCPALTEITIPSTVTEMGEYAFSGETGLEKTIHFTGNSPQFGDNAFYEIVATVYYPADNATWTSEVMQDYGGTIIWAPDSGPATSGICGDDLTWEFDNDSKTLTISGTGAMYDYDYNGAPWKSYVEEIQRVELPDTLTGLGAYAFAGCSSLKEITIPGSITEIAHHAFADCTGLETVIFEGAAPNNTEGMGAPFEGVTADAWYPAGDASWTEEVMIDIGPQMSWFAEGPVRNNITMEAAELDNVEAVWIDGRRYFVEYKRNVGMIDLPDSNSKTMVAYTWHEDDPEDIHTRYPVSMKVWTLGNEDGFYTVTRQESLDNILQYAGMSIRVTGKKGIRMITSIEKDKKNALVSDDLAGFTLKEYGTLVAWENQLGSEPLVLGKDCVKSNYAYKKGVADPVFADDGNLIQYTNVLVGFSNSQCKNDLVMRSYMILEDAEGSEVTLYGGIVQRSIGYIALQNKDTFAVGTEAYDYVRDIIQSVYGDSYDAEYGG